MKTIHRTYKFRLKPNSEQRTLLAKHFGCARFVYNHFLAERQEEYKNTGKSSNYYTQQARLTELKKGECEWLKEVNSQTLQVALKNMDTAYQNFFKLHRGFPNFKSKKSKNSFSVPQNCSVDEYKIYIPKFREGIAYFKDRKVKGVVKSMTISLTPSGKYFVSILTEQQYEPMAKTNKVAGIDLGLKDFVITSDGEKYKNNRVLNKYQNKLATAQKHLSRKQKGSNNFEKQRVKVARLYEKVSNTRTDYLHKVSLDLVRNYDVICLEDLNIKGMMKNHRLARQIGDVAWGEFVGMLTYKAELNDKKIVKIDRFYPSSKTCHNCGYVKKDLKLSDRKWVCPDCGAVLDRDVNAAMNILSAGLADYTCGDSVKPAMVGVCEARTPTISIVGEVRAFHTKHDFSTADWIGSGIGEIVCVDDEIFLNFDDVRYDIDHTADHDPNAIWRWWQYCQQLERLGLPKRINFSSWCKGAPHPYSDKQLEDLGKLYEAVLEAKERFDEAKDNLSF